MATDSIKIDVDVKGAREGARHVEALADSMQDAAEKVQALNERIAETADEAQKLFAKGLSESLPEQLSDIANGFSIAGDKSLSMATRFTAGAGASLIAKNAIMDFGARVMDFGRALDEANVRSEAQTRRLRELGAATREIRQLNGEAVQSTDAYSLRVALLSNGLQATAREQAQLVELARRRKLADEDNAAAIARVTAAINGDVAAQRLLGMSTNANLTPQERMREALALSVREHERLGSVQLSAAEQAAINLRNQQRGSDAMLRLGATILGVSEAYGALNALGAASGAVSERLSRVFTRQHDDSRRLGTATNNLEQETGKLARTGAQTKDQMQALNDRLREQRDLANQAALAQKSLAESLQQVSLAGRTGETFDDTVNRNLRALNRTLVGRDQERRVQREVFRRAVRGGARASAVREVLGMQAPARSQTVPKWLEMSLADKEREESLRAARAEMTGEIDTKRDEQLAFLQQLDDADAQQRRDNNTRASVAGEERYQGSLDYERRQRRGIFGNAADQFSERFGATRTAAEQQVALTQQTAESISGAYDQMTQGLNGFLDTLIESPEKAGEASVNLAKGVLKGIAMMAVQKSIFSLAEGFAALGSANPASATQFFIASGIYAGVAVGAGAGAAGIAAAQRGTQPTPPTTAGSMNSGPARIGSGNGSNREVPMYTININGSVLDEGGMEDAIVRGIRGARARGALN